MKPRNENAPVVTSIRGAYQNHNPAGLHIHSTPNTDEGIVEGYEFFPPGRYAIMFDFHDFIRLRGWSDRIRLRFTITLVVKLEAARKAAVGGWR